jgi:hypothetical protein
MSTMGLTRTNQGQNPYYVYGNGRKMSLRPMGISERMQKWTEMKKRNGWRATIL